MKFSRKRNLYTRLLAAFPACPGCGVRFGAANRPTIDHKVPRSRGGESGDNLWLLCELCNRDKSSRTVEEWLCVCRHGRRMHARNTAGKPVWRCLIFDCQCTSYVQAHRSPGLKDRGSTVLDSYPRERQ